MQKNRAFTLIELLVVIAIIAILAAIVLVSLTTAQNRAKDARVTAGMNQMRTAGQAFYSTNNTYTGFAASSDASKIETDLESSAVGSTVEIRVNQNGNAFCATATLPTGGYWCVDSNLKSEKDANGTLVNCVAGCVAGNTCACD